MSIAAGGWVATTTEITAEFGWIGYRTVPPRTEGYVLEIEKDWQGGVGSAKVRFKIDGQECEAWIDADDLMPL